MGLLDGILSRVSDHADVANLATKLGIDPAIAEKAIAALGVSHQEAGDTIEGAAAKTGLDSGILSRIVEQIGGEGSLTEFARMLQDNPQAKGVFSWLDKDGDGNPINDVTDFAKGLFGKS